MLKVIMAAGLFALASCSGREAEQTTANSEAAAPAAQNAADDRPTGFAAMDDDGDRRLTGAEHAASAAAMFTKMDLDKDGSLSQAEFDAGHKAMLKT